jgi:hypothetical protein
MDSRIQLLETNTSTNINYMIDEQVDHNQDWGGRICYYKKIEYCWNSITNNNQLFLLTNKLENDQHYYVHMHQNPIVIEEHPKEINVVSLDEHSPMVF